MKLTELEAARLILEDVYGRPRRRSMAAEYKTLTFRAPFSELYLVSSRIIDVERELRRAAAIVGNPQQVLFKRQGSSLPAPVSPRQGGLMITSAATHSPLEIITDIFGLVHAALTSNFIETMITLEGLLSLKERVYPGRRRITPERQDDPEAGRVPKELIDGEDARMSQQELAALVPIMQTAVESGRPLALRTRSGLALTVGSNIAGEVVEAGYVADELQESVSASSASIGHVEGE